LAQADLLGPKVGGSPSLLLYSSDELDELTVAVHCYDDSTINIVVPITITIAMAIIFIVSKSASIGW